MEPVQASCKLISRIVSPEIEMCPPKVGRGKPTRASASDGAHQLVGSVRSLFARGPGCTAGVHRRERLHMNDIDAPKPIGQLAHPSHVVPATGYAGDVVLDRFWREVFHTYF